MLSALVKESKARRAELATENGACPYAPQGSVVASLTRLLCRARVAERRKSEAVAAVGAATGAAMDAINGGAATVWHNQQQLELEARTLQEQAKRFAKQSGQWLATHQAFHSSLKALGDVENWARSLESDMGFVNSSLEEVERRREMREAEPPKQPHKIEDVLGDAAK